MSKKNKSNDSSESEEEEEYTIPTPKRSSKKSDLKDRKTPVKERTPKKTPEAHSDKKS
jgi:hypothetical protein